MTSLRLQSPNLAVEALLTHDGHTLRRGADDWQIELSWLRRVVETIGHKHVAGELDIAPSTLTDALLERERKAMKGEWIAKIRKMCSEAMRREYLSIVCPAIGFETPEPIQTRTAEERLAEIERLLADRFGDVGRQLLSEVRR